MKQQEGTFFKLGNMEGTNTDIQATLIEEKTKKIFSGSPENQGNCPIKDIMDRFGDKWSIYTLLLLGRKRKMRFNEIKNEISGISQRMLTVTLRSLEQDGLVDRTIYPEIPPRVEYNLTELGKSLMIQTLSMAEWASDNMNEIIKARKRYELKNAKQLVEEE